MSDPLFTYVSAKFKLGGGDEVAEGEAPAVVVEAVEAEVAGDDSRLLR